MIRRRALAAGAVALASAVAACAASAEQTALTDSSDFTQYAYVTPGTQVILGLPPLRNQSKSTVQITSMQWLDYPPTITVLSVRAVAYSQTDGGIGIGYGALRSIFPSATPHPVTSAVIPPGNEPKWMVLMTVRVSPHTKPGTITFTRARVDYIENGQMHWQYRTMNSQIRVVEHLPR